MRDTTPADCGFRFPLPPDPPFGREPFHQRWARAKQIYQRLTAVLRETAVPIGFQFCPLRESLSDDLYFAAAKISMDWFADDLFASPDLDLFPELVDLEAYLEAAERANDEGWFDNLKPATPRHVLRARVPVVLSHADEWAQAPDRATAARLFCDRAAVLFDLAGETDYVPSPPGPGPRRRNLLRVMERVRLQRWAGVGEPPAFDPEGNDLFHQFDVSLNYYRRWLNEMPAAGPASPWPWGLILPKAAVVAAVEAAFSGAGRRPGDEVQPPVGENFEGATKARGGTTSVRPAEQAWPDPMGVRQAVKYIKKMRKKERTEDAVKSWIRNGTKVAGKLPAHEPGGEGTGYKIKLADLEAYCEKFFAPRQPPPSDCPPERPAAG